MANTATAQTALPIRTKGVGVDIIPYVIAIDTVDTDLTIVTPTGTAMACVVGVMFSEGTAGTLTFKSGTTTLMALELAANQGLFLPLGDQVYFATQPSEALKIRSSVAITNMLIYVVSNFKSGVLMSGFWYPGAFANSDFFGSGLAYPMDTVTGAAAGWGLRRLRSAYSGSAIRVRRSSDNAEQDIGFTGHDLDTVSLSAFIGGGSGFIVKWYDQSGNSRDAVQATAANQPRIVNAGTLDAKNGKPAIYSGAKYLSAPMSGVTGAFTALMVAATASGGNAFGRLLTLFKSGDANDSSVTTSMQVFTKFGNDNKIAAFGNGSSVSTGSNNVTVDILFQATNSNTAGNSDSVYINGTIYNTNSLTLALAPTELDFGGSVSVASSANCYFSELIFYGSTLSAGNRQLIEANQKAYYGTP